jgi:superfamily II DNA/RNA helicase
MMIHPNSLNPLTPNISLQHTQKHKINRDRAASLLLATPSASRGLDLPAVSHVYNLGVPASGAREYLHRAGRAGRIGSTTGGLVTSIVTQDELPTLKFIAAELGLTLAIDVEDGLGGLGLLPQDGSGGGGDGIDGGGGAEKEDLDRVKQGLEDIFKLM